MSWSGDCQKFIGRNAKRSDIVQVLPGFEPGTLDSKSRVLNHYTTEPRMALNLENRSFNRWTCIKRISVWCVICRPMKPIYVNAKCDPDLYALQSTLAGHAILFP